MDKFIIIIKPGFIHHEKNIMKMLKGCVAETVSRGEPSTWNVEVAKEFYWVHRDRSFYTELVEYMTSDKTVCYLVIGSIKSTREMIGDTDSQKASTGTVRAIYGIDKQRNAIHCSDSVESANYEIDVLSRFDLI